MKEIPGYVYSDNTSQSLQQGDIIRVQGLLADKFNEFYPTLNHEAIRQDQFVMVLTQSCDLVRDE